MERADFVTLSVKVAMALAAVTALSALASYSYTETSVLRAAQMDSILMCKLVDANAATPCVAHVMGRIVISASHALPVDCCKQENASEVAPRASISLSKIRRARSATLRASPAMVLTLMIAWPVHPTA